MSFKNWLENNLREGQWQTFQGMGYSVDMTQYSNKGPMFIVKDPKGQELGRTHFNLFSMSWKSS